MMKYIFKNNITKMSENEQYYIEKVWQWYSNLNMTVLLHYDTTKDKYMLQLGLLLLASN